MSHALYTALSGAIAQERALEVISDNMANMATQGFKASRLTFAEVWVDGDPRTPMSLAERNRQQAQARAATEQGGPAGPATFGVPNDPNADAVLSATSSGPPRMQVRVASTALDLQQGSIKDTGNPLHFALTSPGFFVVSTPAGERLTRQGSFVVAPDGGLVNMAGDAVLGTRGPIRMHPHAEVASDIDGALYADGMFVDTLLRVDVHDPQDLVRRGDAMWAVAEGAEAREVPTTLQPGALEQSNVSAIGAMTQLIAVQRAYEGYHRVMEAVRGLEQKTTNELG